MYKRVRELRLENKLKMREVAEVLGMSVSGYSSIEYGANDLSSKIIIALAKFYKVKTDYILGLED